ncbi:MAG: benzoyl-CoA reductase, bzd-type, subunit Q [Planctomycetota bacterium]|jgi:bzd-type benzoyl-CoA reductase Q subunit
MIETKTDYWRWAESNWRNENIDWRKANILSAGVDVGSVSSQAVVMADGKLLAYSNMRTGSNSPDSARNAMSWAIEGTDLKVEDIHFIVGTGYGRVNVPFAHKTITEIHCHARGGNFMYGDKVRTVMDMGGQDCKAIRCDGRGKVVAFQMNDKCAAGTGRGMEVFADLLQIPIDRVGPMSLSVAEEPPPVSSTCVVFAKSEAAGLLRQGWDKEKVLAAYCSAMAHRVFNLLERVGVEREFAITGGIAKNPGVVERIERELGFESLKSDIDSQIAGAVGAALFGLALETKKRAKGTG